MYVRWMYVLRTSYDDVHDADDVVVVGDASPTATTTLPWTAAAVVVARPYIGRRTLYRVRSLI